MDTLDDRFVLCGCQPPWQCRDPNTLPRGRQRTRQRKRPGPGGVFVDRL